MLTLKVKEEKKSLNIKTIRTKKKRKLIRIIIQYNTGHKSN